MMIFKLKTDFSKEDLQKSYKKLVKKYHPDSNPKNQEWSHNKMTEINLAYEACCSYLESNNEINQENPNYQPAKEQNKDTNEQNLKAHKKKQQNSKINQEITPDLYKRILNISNIYTEASEIFFEYGLEKRKLRYEGVRRFRYRESLRIFDDAVNKTTELDQYCKTEYDQYAVNLFLRFTGNLFHYIQLDERHIPDHPLLNRHWDLMEEYMLYSIKDYLVPHLVHNFRKMSANTSFTQCWNQLIYLQTRFPALDEDKTFKICHNLADSLREIRREEYEMQYNFFNYSES
ncbi:J domain-containing protein [Oceanispirochaeta sp. M1]|uniref:J domain-containing protein n=2 Tax=Oceanispirochaeta TaxID=2035349 RepID=UPI0014953120|nr:J domain-containing protein [Oceanispirochaeta sp. M1]